MSFRDIAAIINKWKEQEKGQLDDDIKSKSKTTQAIKLFSQDKNPVDVVIALDLPSEEVQAIYREYWELKSMFSLAQIYDEAEYDLNDLLRLHRIFKNLGMSEKEIINVLELAKNNQLQYLQWKVEYLRNDIDMLEVKKAKATNDVLKLNSLQSSLSQKRGETAYMNQEPRMLQGSINYNADYSYPNINWYSVDIFYTPMNDYSAEPPDVIDNFVK
jgi:hypothetical protein